METAAFGPHELQTPYGGFVWSGAEENKMRVQLTGAFTSYDGSGYVRDLDTTNRSAYLAGLNLLEENNWVDRQTRCAAPSRLLNLASPCI